MRGSEFSQLTAFVAVAEHSSFTRAAAHLGISTPTLSQTIRALEERLGVRLLNRTTRSVALSEAGEQLLGHLGPVLEGIETAIDSVTAFRDRPAGTLRLAVHPVAAVTVLAPLVAHFASTYPEIRLDICVDDGRRDIVSGRFDAGVHFADSVAQDMIAVPVGEKLRLSTVAAPRYLARCAPPSTPDDLRQHNCIRYHAGAGEPEHGWTFANAHRQVEISVAGSLHVNDLEFALRVALDGVGIVQLPDVLVAPFIAEGRLVPVLPEWTSEGADFVLFFPSRRHVPVKLRTLVDFLRRESRPRAKVELHDTARRRPPVHVIDGARAAIAA